MIKEKILLVVSDLVADFLYYDRKEDVYLQLGVIEEAIANREITLVDIVEQWRRELEKGLRNSD